MSTFILIPLSPHTFHFNIYTYMHFNIIKLDGIPLTYIYICMCVGAVCACEYKYLRKPEASEHLGVGSRAEVSQQHGWWE